MFVHVSKYGLSIQLLTLKKFVLKMIMKEECFETCRRKYVSKDDKEWICETCRNVVKDGKIPKLSVQNKMGFPPIPPGLNLHLMEKRLISLRIVFMMLRDHPVGGQTFVRGNFVNVPVDIAPTVNTLPRSLSETETVAIKFKRKKQYKNVNIRKLSGHWQYGKL